MNRVNPRPPITVREMITLAADVFDTTEKDILSKSRWRPHARARQAVFALANRHGWSLTAIGRVFDRDHSTVGHGRDMAPVFCRYEPQFAERMVALESAVRERCGA